MSEGMSAVERASSLEQANEWAAKEGTEERQVEYSTRRFHMRFIQCALSRQNARREEATIENGGTKNQKWGGKQQRLWQSKELG